MNLLLTIRFLIYELIVEIKYLPAIPAESKMVLLYPFLHVGWGQKKQDASCSKIHRIPLEFSSSFFIRCILFIVRKMNIRKHFLKLTNALMC